MSANRKWYVVQTQPNAEHKAFAHLSRQGFEVFLPRYRKRRRHARRVDVVAAPLFPRYLFVAIDVTTQRWRSVRSTAGVAQLVSNGDVPVAIGDDIVAALRQRQDEGGFIQLEAAPFTPGEKVRVTDGAFADCLGLFDGMTDGERVAVLVDLLGRRVRVEMDVLAIEAA